MIKLKENHHDDGRRAASIDRVRSHTHRSRVTSAVLTALDVAWFVALVLVALSRPTMIEAICAAISCLVPAGLTLWLINRVEHAPVVDYSVFDDPGD
jgi:hypothetical protein